MRGIRTCNPYLTVEGNGEDNKNSRSLMPPVPGELPNSALDEDRVARATFLNSTLMRQDIPNDNWMDKLTPIMTFQSPSLQPRSILESPGLQPYSGPFGFCGNEDTPFLFSQSSFRRPVAPEFPEAENVLSMYENQSNKESILSFFRPFEPRPKECNCPKNDVDFKKPSLITGRVPAPDPQDFRITITPTLSYTPARMYPRQMRLSEPSPQMGPFASPGYPYVPPVQFLPPISIDEKAPEEPLNLEESEKEQPDKNKKIEPEKVEEPVMNKSESLAVKENKPTTNKYQEKKKRRIWSQKVTYGCRKKLAEKRLRIKGKFVTAEQALAMLGTTREELLKNEEIRNVAQKNANCSIIAGSSNFKVRNIQNLLGEQNDSEKSSSLAHIQAKEKPIEASTNPKNNLLSAIPVSDQFNSSPRVNYSQSQPEVPPETFPKKLLGKKRQTPDNQDLSSQINKRSK